ncbi:ornithine carbamoyltransferase [candidate division FCPU426 bacterium]|nr:ornithine carbamoyltransferase [candidate division FCPU426 bacterium]
MSSRKKPAPVKKKKSQQRLSVGSLLTIAQLSKDDVELILKTAAELKAAFTRGQADRSLQGRVLAGIFEKSSTRTRVSFETAMFQLGGVMLYLAGRDLQLGRGETIADTARVLSRYVGGIIIRTDAHRKVVEMAREASVPVINALTDYAHPCQVLADLLTMQERFGKLKGLRVAYVGDGNNVARSLIYGAAKTGIELALASPLGYEMDKDTVELSESVRVQNKGALYLTMDPQRAVAHADVVYTDVWVSMGQEKDQAQRVRALKKYQVNDKLMSYAAPHAVFMHCLPAHRGQEVTDEVIDGKQSIVFTQAENRLHTQKAILKLLMK